MKQIFVKTLEDMAKVCAELARQGIAFQAIKRGNNEWQIEIVGY